MNFKPDLSVNKVLAFLDNSPYEGAWIDFEGEKHSGDLGYIYDFFKWLKQYLQEHPEHIEMFDKKYNL